MDSGLPGALVPGMTAENRRTYRRFARTDAISTTPLPAIPVKLPLNLSHPHCD